MVRKRGRGVFNFWASICYEMFPIRHLMERAQQTLADRRGVNESTSVKARGSRVRRVSSPDSRKAFPRIVEDPNAVKGNSGTQRRREKETERNDGFLRASARMKPVRSGFFRVDPFPEEQSSMRELAVFLNASDYFHQLLELRSLVEFLDRGRKVLSVENSLDRYRFSDYCKFTPRYKCNCLS